MWEKVKEGALGYGVPATDLPDDEMNRLDAALPEFQLKKCGMWKHIVDGAKKATPTSADEPAAAADEMKGDD